MQLKVPMLLVRGWSRFVDWGDNQLWSYGRLELRIIDCAIAAGFVFCITWYWLTAGWQGAAAGAVLYVVLLALASFTRG
jgi:hypothetical protein